MTDEELGRKIVDAIALDPYKLWNTEECGRLGRAARELTVRPAPTREKVHEWIVSSGPWTCRNSFEVAYVAYTALRHFAPPRVEAAGMVLVPRVATLGMLNAGWEKMFGKTAGPTSEVWAAMIAAAQEDGA